MKKWLQLSLLIVLALQLIACNQPRSYDYFLSHLDQLLNTYHQCSQLPGPEAYVNKECVNAINAMQRVRPVILQAPSSALQFGLQILKAQEKLGQLQQSLQDAKNKKMQLQKVQASADGIAQQQTAITQLIQSVADQKLNVQIMLELLKLNNI